MSNSLKESITMPEMVQTEETISDRCPELDQEVPNDGRTSSSVSSPSSETGTQASPPTAAEATAQTVLTDSPTPHAEASLEQVPVAPNLLPVEPASQAEPEIPDPVSSAPSFGIEPGTPTALTEMPEFQTKPGTVNALPVSLPPRKVSFPTGSHTETPNLSPTGCDKEPSKDLKGLFTPVHRLSAIEIPGRISDTPATSFGALVKLWVVVILTLALCVGLMVAAHLTHSLTLTVEAYHSLYNAGALAGSLISIKMCRQPESLLNTFGWARIDVVSYLISLIFLSSLCFSVAVEAVQHAAHVQHQDPMHFPLATILIAVAALAVNALVFVLIGGYTQHQGSFLEMRVSGDVFVKKQVRQDSLQTGQKTLSSRRSTCPKPATLRQGYKDILRDIAGLLLTVACAGVILKTEGSIFSFYVDPAVAVISVVILMWLSYPFAKECSSILLQTIPEHIDVERFSERLQESFPAILNVHHLHIWSLRPGKVVSTIHVVFANKDVYGKISQSLTVFFKKEGISLVTLQPEFMDAGDANKAKCCCSDHLLDGAGDSCDDHSWQSPDDHDDHDHKDHDHKHANHHHHKNGHSHAHDHNQKHDTVGGHDHHHAHLAEDLSESRPTQNLKEDVSSTTVKQALHGKSKQEQTCYESSKNQNETSHQHCKLHENQIHQDPETKEDDTSCSHEITHEEETSGSKARLSTTSSSSIEQAKEMLATCNASVASDPQGESDERSASSEKPKLQEELKRRSVDDELKTNGAVECPVGIVCEGDRSLDYSVSAKPEAKEVAANLKTLHPPDDTLSNSVTEDSSISNSRWIVLDETSSIQGDEQPLNDTIQEGTTHTIENEVPSQVRIDDNNHEAPAVVDCLLSVPKIEITLRELIVSDEDGNRLFSDMRYASGCPDVEVTGNVLFLRKASSESYLLENSTESAAETETKPRSDSTLSADENSAMLEPIDKVNREGSNFSLTRSVEKLSGPPCDHSMR